MCWTDQLSVAIEKVFNKMESMSDEEFLERLKNYECSNLTWLLMYAEDPELNFVDYMKICCKQMWE